MTEDFPQGGLIGKTLRLWRRFSRLQISAYAAGAGYFIALALLPGLILIMGFLRYTALDIMDLMELLEGFIPAALYPLAQELIFMTYDQTSTAVLSISALTALWSASRGLYGLLAGLNAVYGREETRGYWRTRTLCVFYTFLFLLVLLLTLVLNVFGIQLLGMIPITDHPLSILFMEILDLRFFLLLFVQTGVFTAMFMFLPNGRNTLHASLPGALLASLGWTIFSNLFSIYVRHFTGYESLYGSLYAVALSMLWLYFCLCIVFYGGALNRYLEEDLQ